MTEEFLEFIWPLASIPSCPQDDLFGFLLVFHTVSYSVILLLFCIQPCNLKSCMLQQKWGLDSIFDWITIPGNVALACCLDMLLNQLGWQPLQFLCRKLHLLQVNPPLGSHAPQPIWQPLQMQDVKVNFMKYLCDHIKFQLDETSRLPGSQNQGQSRWWFYGLFQGG